MLLNFPMNEMEESPWIDARAVIHSYNDVLKVEIL